MTPPPPIAPPAGTPSPSLEAAKRRLAAELSLPSRLAYTLLLLVGLAGATLVGSLLATEPALPPRTRIAFAALVLVGLAWAAFAAWVLARRRVLLALHRVVAARLAILFCGAFTLGSLMLGWRGAPGGPWWSAAVAGAAMLAAAVVLLARANRRREALGRRRREIERELDARGAGR